MSKTLSADAWWAAEQRRMEEEAREAALLALAPAKLPAPTNVVAADSWRRAVNEAAKDKRGGEATPQPLHSGSANALDAWRAAIAKR
jgi:hypothetical protein